MVCFDTFIIVYVINVLIMYSLGDKTLAGNISKICMHSNMALVLDFQFCLSLSGNTSN